MSFLREISKLELAATRASQTIVIVDLALRGSNMLEVAERIRLRDPAMMRRLERPMQPTIEAFRMRLLNRC